MRKWLFLPLLVLVAGSPITSCSNNDEGDSAARSSDERQSESDPDSSDGGSEGGSGDDSGGSGSSGSDPDDPMGSILDDARETATSILEEADGVIGEVSECVDVSITFGKLQAATLGGSDGVRQAEEAAAELKGLVPEDLADDIDVVAEALGQVAEEGLTSGSTALNTPEYEAAMNELSDYIESECGLT